MEGDPWSEKLPESRPLLTNFTNEIVITEEVHWDAPRGRAWLRAVHRGIPPKNRTPNFEIGSHEESLNTGPQYREH